MQNKNSTKTTRENRIGDWGYGIISSASSIVQVIYELFLNKLFFRLTDVVGRYEYVWNDAVFDAHCYNKWERLERKIEALMNRFCLLGVRLISLWLNF